MRFLFDTEIMLTLQKNFKTLVLIFCVSFIGTLGYTECLSNAKLLPWCIFFIFIVVVFITVTGTAKLPRESDTCNLPILNNLEEMRGFEKNVTLNFVFSPLIYLWVWLGWLIYGNLFFGVDLDLSDTFIDYFYALTILFILFINSSSIVYRKPMIVYVSLFVILTSLIFIQDDNVPSRMSSLNLILKVVLFFFVYNVIYIKDAYVYETLKKSPNTKEILNEREELSFILILRVVQSVWILLLTPIIIYILGPLEIIYFIIIIASKRDKNKEEVILKDIDIKDNKIASNTISNKANSTMPMVNKDNLITINEAYERMNKNFNNNKQTPEDKEKKKANKKHLQEIDNTIIEDFLKKNRKS